MNLKYCGISSVSESLLQLIGPSILYPLLGILVGIAVMGLATALIVRTRRIRARTIDQVLLTRERVSIDEIPSLVNAEYLTVSSIRGLVRHTRNGVLSFGGTSVVSLPLLKSHLRDQLFHGSRVSVSQESLHWGLREDLIGQLVEQIAREEHLDILRTDDGDYVVVKEMKDHLRDVIEIQGRLDLTSESQRLGVSRDKLLELIESWGWDVIELGDGSVVSSRWMRVSLERVVLRRGYIDLKEEARRLGITDRDILRVVRAFDWKTIETPDGRIVPVHVVEERISDELERHGVVDVRRITSELALPRGDVLRIVREIDPQVIETRHGTVVTLEYLRRRIRDDIDLMGSLLPQEEAEVLGIDARLVARILTADSSCRRASDGRFVSLRALRQWILDKVSETGVIRAADVEAEWGVSRVDLTVLLRRFGLKTTRTNSGDFLSLAWARHAIKSKIDAGEAVSAETVVSTLGVDEGTAVAILASVEADAVLTHDGHLIPETQLRDRLLQMLHEGRAIGPDELARTMNVDISDVHRVLNRIVSSEPVLRLGDGRVILNEAVLATVRDHLAQRGTCDILQMAQRLGAEFDALLRLVTESLREGEIVVDTAGCVVTEEWIRQLRQEAEERGRVQVTVTARRYGVRRSAMLHLLRHFLRGAYVRSRDLFLVAASR